MRPPAAGPASAFRVREECGRALAAPGCPRPVLVPTNIGDHVPTSGLPPPVSSAVGIWRAEPSRVTLPSVRPPTANLAHDAGTVGRRTELALVRLDGPGVRRCFPRLLTPAAYGWLRQQRLFLVDLTGPLAFRQEPSAPIRSSGANRWTHRWEIWCSARESLAEIGAGRSTAGLAFASASRKARRCSSAVGDRLGMCKVNVCGSAHVVRSMCKRTARARALAASIQYLRRCSSGEQPRHRGR